MKTLIQPVFAAGYWLGAAAIVVCMALLVLVLMFRWSQAGDVITSPFPKAKPVAPWVSPVPARKAIQSQGDD